MPKAGHLWHCMDEPALWRAMGSAPFGLTHEQAAAKRLRNGPNELAQERKKSFLAVFLSQFSDFMIWILMAAAVISLALGERIDALIIGVVVAMNGILGAVQESRAEAALDALRLMAAPSARVLRAGRVAVVPARDLVAGDVVLLEAGDAVPADLRLIESASLRIEESALTGESVPVEKTVCVLADPACSLGDRVNMAYMGTAVTYGRGRGVTTATGMETQMGRIAAQIGATPKELTPLQKQLGTISSKLSAGVLSIAALVFLLAWLRGPVPGSTGNSHILNSFLTAVSLAVAAIPEGMVAVITIVLAMGMSRMAGRGAIIRRLPAVETLGSTQVICSDKTGTLTLNRMTVVETKAQNPALLHEAMLQCNDAVLDQDGKPSGDPTETALLDYLLRRQHSTPHAILNRKRAGEIPFDSERKRSSVIVGRRLYCKGAPDVVLALCDMPAAQRAEALAANEMMARKALRVLAFAYRDADYNNGRVNPTPADECNLTFIGLAGMIDPARPEAKQAIAVCKKAGILPIMITGDHKTTAVAIARELGITGRAVLGAEIEAMADRELLRAVPDIAVYARVSPEHKRRIVAAWQKRGSVVAMTGDGVNDAPALRLADIGVGMGIAGTEVSKGASDMVLTDDNFATIVLAVEEGRRIFDNIHKTVRFLLSSNAGEVLAILFATLMGWVMLDAKMILWINLVTDTFPALALGVEPAEADIMDRPPRGNRKGFFTGREWGQIVSVGAVEAALAVSAFLLGIRATGDLRAGSTMAFLTLSLSQLFAAVGFQSERHSVFDMKGKHPYLWLAFAASTALQLLVVLFPPMRRAFNLVMLGPTEWITVAALCFIMLAFIEVQKWRARRRGKKKN
jgi:Ca2+-transporting ATPase